MDKLLKERLDWYVYLAQQPGFKAHAWHMAKQFAREHPFIYGRLPELLQREMEKRNARD